MLPQIVINDNLPYLQVLRIKPPMCITKEDVDFAVSVFKDALEKNSS